MNLSHDDVVGDVRKSLHDWVKEAYKQAIKEGIDANTVVLNKNFIKTNGFAFCISNHFWHDLPPMICGLEIRVADDLPEKVDFALIKANMTERENLVRQTILDTVRKMRTSLYEEFIKIARCQVADEPNMRSREVFLILDQITNEILNGEKHESESENA